MKLTIEEDDRNALAAAEVIRHYCTDRDCRSCIFENSGCFIQEETSPECWNLDRMYDIISRWEK